MKKLWILIIMLQGIYSGLIFANDGEVALDLNISLEVETATVMNVHGEYDFGVQSISNKTIKSSEVLIMLEREDHEEAEEGCHVSLPKEIELRSDKNIIIAKLKIPDYSNPIEDPEDSSRWRVGGIGAKGKVNLMVESNAIIELKGDEKVGSYEGEVLIKGRIY